MGGVLVLHMLIGRTRTRDFLDSLEHNERSRVDSWPLGLDPEMLVSMLQDDPEKRPHPREVVKALQGDPGLAMGAKAEGSLQALRSRSRSRSPKEAAGKVPPKQGS